MVQYLHTKVMNNLNLSLIALILSVFCLLGLILLYINFRSINKLRKSLFLGKKAVDLEDVIHIINNNLNNLKDEHSTLEHAFKQLQNDFAFAFQKIGVIRFNPFADGGGNFSFCIALLNAKNTGVIITSMHGREQNRIYTKKIINGKCEIKLTEEEQQAINKACEEFQNI